MSYDVWLEADLGGPEHINVGALAANCTYNVAPMFRKACGESPLDWNKRPAADVHAICCTILEAFNREPAAYRALNPANGWGDFESARCFIQEIADACDQAPAAIVRVG